MPSETLLIVGGGRTGQALARIASLLDFKIVVVDERDESYPDDFDLPNVEQVLNLPPDFAGLPVPDGSTYVALVTRGFDSDEAALRRVIHSPAAYIGMCGNRSKCDGVFEHMRAEGVSEERLAQIHAPIGLKIGSQSPAEIAVSIVAEIIQERAALRSAD
jgi:xanthine dehydrogenase accessory factor